MIQKPDQMDFSKKPFTMIIAGSPGLGKTTLALSAPNPLLFDLDDGISRVQAAHRGLTSMVDSYEALLSDMESDEYKAAESIVIDTGGSLVQMMKPWARKQDPKAARDGRAMFGIIKQGFADLCYRIKNTDRKNLIVVFHTTEVPKGDAMTQRLSCEGSAKDIVWTPADFGCYMHMLGSRRMLGFTPTDEYFAKGCHGICGLREVPALKEGQKNTLLADLLAEARANIAKEAETYAPKRVAYNAAMEAGSAIIAAIESPEDATAAKDELGALAHELTSKTELLNMFKDKVKTIGAVWNKEAQRYEPAQDNAKPA